MTVKAYISNITPRTCPVERQEATLAAKVPGWPRDVSVYRDVKLSAAKRKGKDVAALVERANLLRRTSRKGVTETIYVASLAVLAWTPDDFMACLAAASARNAAVVALDTGRRIEPDAGAADLAEAVKEFAAAKRRPQVGGSLIGAAASRAARLADTARRIALIADDWPRPEHSTPALLLRAGKLHKRTKTIVPMAYSTAVKSLGHRPEAQRKRVVADERIARNQARRKIDAEI